MNMAAMSPILRVEGVGRDYGEVRACNDVSF